MQDELRDMELISWLCHNFTTRLWSVGLCDNWSTRYTAEFAVLLLGEELSEPLNDFTPYRYHYTLSFGNTPDEMNITTSGSIILRAYRWARNWGHVGYGTFWMPATLDFEAACLPFLTTSSQCPTRPYIIPALATRCPPHQLLRIRSTYAQLESEKQHHV